MSLPGKMKILIASESCHKYSERAEAHRKTWIKDVIGADTFFFLGRGSRFIHLPDEIYFDVADDYDSLPLKAQVTCQWALNHSYDYVFLCDDDAYIRPERLFASGFEDFDYIGKKNEWKTSPGYASGGPGYWLSAKAATIIANASISDWKKTEPKESWFAADLWIGTVLGWAGIKQKNDERYSNVLPCLASNDIISEHVSCTRGKGDEHKKIFLAHEDWLKSHENFDSHSHLSHKCS